MPPDATETPKVRLTFQAYADTWLEQRDLKNRTREHYDKLLEDHIVPKFGPLPIAAITADDVRVWHARVGSKTRTLRAHCYGLLRTLMNTALSDGKIRVNPCVIRGASTARRVHNIRPASLDEIKTITQAMPEQYRAIVLLAAWAALRFGELTELRRKHIVIVEPTEDELVDAAATGEAASRAFDTPSRHAMPARGPGQRPANSQAAIETGDGLNAAGFVFHQFECEAAAPATGRTHVRVLPRPT